MTFGSGGEPSSRRQHSEADSVSLNRVVTPASHHPPFLFTAGSRTAANVDSIGLVVRRCTQCPRRDAVEGQ